ncbi:TPA: hypothetical protein DCL37_05535 [Candidatus Acetothermia bacterium]|nr:hypothetical protein [Candidatus Acetothermia bacterium]
MPRFFKDLESLPGELQARVWEKLELFCADPRHPSLRVHKIEGTDNVWELSVTRSIRITYTPETTGDEIIYHLRRVGFHDILRTP